MKEISITGTDKKVLVDDEDFIDISKTAWHISNGYAIRSIKDSKIGKRTESMHRYLLGAKRGQMIDHINRNRLDNQRRNIRIATHADNMHNRLSVNTSGYRGVVKNGSRWRARICRNNIRKFEYCDTAIEAAYAYDRMAKEIHGEFAVLNFP